VWAQSADLDGDLEAARAALDLTDLKLRRTRSRGVFRHGERYIVPYFDEVGVEHRKEFQTRKEARSFRWSVRFAQEQRAQYVEKFNFDKSGNAGAGAGGGGGGS
jgi:hypothetical protein